MPLAIIYFIGNHCVGVSTSQIIAEVRQSILYLNSSKISMVDGCTEIKDWKEVTDTSCCRKELSDPGTIIHEPLGYRLWSMIIWAVSWKPAMCRYVSWDTEWVGISWDLRGIPIVGFRGSKCSERMTLLFFFLSVWSPPLDVAGLALGRAPEDRSLS